MLIGWTQNLVEALTVAPVIDESDEWHWLSLIGLIVAPAATTLWIDPIVAVRVDIVVVTPKKDPISLGNGEY